MKTIQTLILTTVLFGTVLLRAAEPDSATAAKAETAPANSASPKPPPASDTAQAEAPTSKAASADANAAPATNNVALATGEKNPNKLRMNFRDASLDLVLNYLSEAAGFIINIRSGVSVKGKVNIWSSEPMTQDEAVNQLDTQLNQNGLAAIRNGRTLTIATVNEAKVLNIPVIKGGDPEKIPISDKIVTQIIPVRFVEATELIKDLNPLVSDKTTMTADTAGNSIVVTDTQANIRKVAEIIYAIDSSAEDFTEVRLFKLNNADPTETADLLTSLFPDDTKQGSSGQSGLTMNPFFSRFASRFGGGGGGPGGSSGGPGGGGNSNSQGQRIKKRNRVIAVADQRTTSVVVSASKDLMEQIAEVITGLDGDPKGKSVVTIFTPQTIDPDELKSTMNDLFNKNGTGNQNRSGSSSQTSALNGRQTSQNQQYNNTSRSSGLGGSGSRGGLSGGGGSFP